MDFRKVPILFFVIIALLLNAPKAVHAAEEIGINKLKQSILTSIDTEANKVMSQCTGLSLGVAYNYQLVLTKSYGDKRVANAYPLASVSKPLTAMVAMQLVEDGRLSLDTRVAPYAQANGYPIPSDYQSVPLTIKHLLIHRGGVTHLDHSQTSQMFFAIPGTTYLYSSNGYNIIGHILKDTERPFLEMIAKYISQPIGATSISGANSWYDPGGTLKANAQDLTRFGIAVMNHTYISAPTLYNQVLVNYGDNRGLGFKVSGSGNDLTAYHSGSLGVPRSWLWFKPRKGVGVGMLCGVVSSSTTPNLASLTNSIESILASTANPCVNASDCGLTGTPSPSPLPSPSPPAYCRYDYDHNHSLEVGDILYVLSHWGALGAGEILAVLGNWGAGCN